MKFGHELNHLEVAIHGLTTGVWSSQCELHEKRNPGCLGFIGDEILPSYVGIMINHYKDPYKATNIMESKAGFFSVAHMSIP